MRDLNNVKAEEMIQTKEFLVFKDKLVEYLRNFIKGLQRNVGVIEELLRMFPEEPIAQALAKVNNYEMSLPRMDVEISRELIEVKSRAAARKNRAAALLFTVYVILRCFYAIVSMHSYLSLLPCSITLPAQPH